VPTPDDRFGGFSAIQGVALALCFVIPLIGWALLFRQLGRFVALYRLGQPDAGRTGSPGTRTWTLAKEFLGHTRMSRLKVVAVAHWFTALAFLILFTTLVNAFFQLVQPDYRLPIVGHFPPFEWLVEVFAWAGLIGIAVLIAIRQKNHPRSAAGEGGRRSRFFGSTFWQAYYVEATIFFVTICILLLRGLESAMVSRLEPETSLALHFPLTGWMSGLFSGVSLPGLATWVYVVATIKILISFAWMITISLQPTMGVAWHRFLAFPNIWFKREASGRTALGAAKPLTIGGKPFDMEAMEELEEGDTLGVGKVEDFTWKGLLDFSTCTECGRCQSQCPAWNTDKPLSPKLLMMTLRDHADAKAPFLKAAKAGATVGASGAGAGATASELSGVTEGSVIDWASMALVGETGYTADSPLSAYNPHGPDAVIDQDVLWSCTTCGACVEQCPVDIEHVDHIIDMRRYRRSSSRPSRASSGACSRTSRARATRGAWARGRGWTGPRTCPSPSRCSARTSSPRPTSSGCSGSVAPGPTRTVRRRRRVRWPSCSTRPGCRSRCSATARPAPVILHGGLATSCCSRRWRRRTSRRSGSSGSPRSS
jgi:ferredoxin